MLDNNRRLWKYIVFSVLTGGIYGLYFIYKLAKDVNTICEEDGKHTPGLLKYTLLGICTLGVYDIVWAYKLADRLQENAPKYGMSFSEDGATVTKCAVFGLLLFGIGPFVSLYIIIKNTNMLVTGYLQEESVNTGIGVDDEKTGDIILKCPNCGYENDDCSLFCQKCGTKLEWREKNEIQRKPVSEKNYIWVPIVIGCISIVIILYLSYFFAWIPQGKNLSACVGKKLGIVKMMHHVTRQNNGKYYIGDYVLAVDSDKKVVTGIGRGDGSPIREKETYEIQGIFFNQSQEEAKQYLKDKFISIGELGYLFKNNPDYFFTVEFTRKKVSKLSLQYWKQVDREKTWLENARAEAANGNYSEACILYEGIQATDVQQELEECRYSYGKVLYEEGAYLDAEKYFDKLTSDTYSKERDNYLKRINMVKKIFHLADKQIENMCSWYEQSATTMTSKAYLVFKEEDMETWEGSQNAYTVQSWKGEGDLDSLNGEAEYQLKLRRLSDDYICDAKLNIHTIDASMLQNRYVNVSSLDIVVGEDVMNIAVDGVITRQIKTPITKYYTNSTEYNDYLKQLKTIRSYY